MDVSDLARVCVPRASLARRRGEDENDREAAIDAFARDAEAHLVAIRAKIERSGLELSSGLRGASKTPRRLVEVVEDDAEDVVVRDAAAASESCAVLLACAAHGALRDGDAPAWSSRRASGAAAETYDAGLRSASFTVTCFEETCEMLFEALVSPKNAFGDEADEDEAAARVASRQLLWCLQRQHRLMDEDSARVVSAALPCVLRAMDYPSDVVKTTGARCAREMTRVGCELDWRATGAGAPLLHAAREALVGCTADVWPHALDVACALTHRLASGTPEVVEEFRKTFSRALDCASLHGADASYAKPLLETFSSFIRVAKSCVVAHLNRLLPLLCRYMQSHRDDVAIGAAELLSVVVENSWPRARSYGASVWPDVKRAYAEADARSSKSCDDMRRALERACALVQLASGGTFSEVWNVDEEARRLSHCADLMTFLDSLPEVVREAE